jgi:hypothetical protein
LFDNCIRQIVGLVRPASLLELGCGQGKFGALVQAAGHSVALTAVQKLFGADDEATLKARGYGSVIDRDILDFYREGFDQRYDLIVALDVIEHFLYSDVLSIVNFSLYRADYMLLVWPSAHPQEAGSSPFDRHRASFELKDLSDRFDVAFYAQTGFAQMHYQHRYHIALLRGFMNARVLPPFLP